MPKEKKRLIEEKEQQVTMFYYEIIGSFAIIFSITILGKLGKVGTIFTIFFKVAFGDWYWLFVLLFLFIGLYSLFMHDKFDFRSHRFIGFLFITICILTYSHFPVHNYISTSSTSYFSSTWSLYRNFINGSNPTSLGGGMLGAVLFYAIYYLLGSIGVILLGIILIILGVSLMFNRTLKELLLTIKNWFSKLGSYFKSFNRFFRYEIGSDLDKKSVEQIANVSIPLKIFTDYDNSIIKSYQEKEASRTTIIIKNVLNDFRLNYNEQEIIISYYVTTYKYNILSVFDYMTLFKKIKEKIHNECLFSINNNQIIIQITSKDKMILSIKELYSKYDGSSDVTFPIGINYLNEVLTIDLTRKLNMLILGTNFVGIKNFVYYFIVSLLIRNPINNYEFYLFDEVDAFNKIHYLFKSTDKDIFNFLDMIKKITEERIELLKENNVNTYKDYLKAYEMGEIKNMIKEIYIFIGDIFSDIDDTRIIESKILYLNQIAKKVGIIFIYIVRNSKYINNTLFSVFENKLLFKCSNELINKINNDYSKDASNLRLQNALYLDGNGDCLFVNKNNQTRFLTPLITNHELDKIKKIYKK